MKDVGGEEGRDESVVGKRLEGMEESRLVKMVVDKLREDGGIGWWEEDEAMRRKLKLDNEVSRWID